MQDINSQVNCFICSDYFCISVIPHMPFSLHATIGLEDRLRKVTVSIKIYLVV